MTTNFYRFSNRAILSTNLASGTYTWSATIADYAGNTVTSAVSFSATGMANTNAPVMSGLNVTDAITLMPDMPEIWVQGNISGNGSTVYASVNGGDAIAINMMGGTFGYLLPLDYGTNVIVLAGGDGTGTNVGSQVLLVERSDKFQATVETPVLGMFANGSNVVASGVVSAKYAAGTEAEMTLVSLTINGVAATLGTPDQDGNVAWSTSDPINLVNGQPNREAISMTATLCWSDGTNTVCRTMPWGLLEGYEIISLDSRKMVGGSINLEEWQARCGANLYANNNYWWGKYIYQFGLSNNVGYAQWAYRDVGETGQCVTATTTNNLREFNITTLTDWMEGETGVSQTWPDILWRNPPQWDTAAAQGQPADEYGNYIRGFNYDYDAGTYIVEPDTWIKIEDDLKHSESSLSLESTNILKLYATHHGVTFPKGSGFLFGSRYSTIDLRNIRKNLDRFEYLLRKKHWLWAVGSPESQPQKNFEESWGSSRERRERMLSGSVE